MILQQPLLIKEITVAILTMYKQIPNYNIDIERLKTETVLLLKNRDLFSDVFKTQLGLIMLTKRPQTKYLDAVGSLDWDYEKMGWRRKSSQRQSSRKILTKLCPIPKAHIHMIYFIHSSK